MAAAQPVGRLVCRVCGDQLHWRGGNVLVHRGDGQVWRDKPRSHAASAR